LTHSALLVLDCYLYEN